MEQKNFKREKAKKDAGITLIALVVTIIVLLILAGISISMLTGQNGILNRAEEAKQQTQDASDLEYLRTETHSALMSYYVSGSNLTQDEYVLDELAKLSGVTINKTTSTVTYNGKDYNISELMGNTDEQNEIANNGLTQITDSSLVTENSNIRMVLEETTKNGKIQAVIPAGFYYVTGKPSTGLVISDVQGDDDQNTKGGNQFVWVPCKRTDGGTEGVTYEKENGLATTWKEKYSSYQYWYTGYTTSTTNPDGTTTTTNNPLKGTWTDKGGNSESVKKYGGFYVARYEAGVPSEEFYATTNNAEYVTNSKKNSEDVLSLSPVSKKNNFSWNDISQEKAIKVSENMYNKEGTSVTSQLIDSYAWDTIVEWMQKNENGIATNSTNKGNYANSTFSTNNGLYALHRLENLTTEANKINAAIDQGTQTGTKYTTHGWKSIYKTGTTVLGYDSTITKEENDNYGFVNYDYRDQTYYYYNMYKEIQTGSAEETKINNIYDMAGNMWEWTTETGNPDGTSTQRAVLRGGSFNAGGSSRPVSFRYGHDGSTWGGDILVGFRVVLYIQQ